MRDDIELKDSGVDCADEGAGLKGTARSGRRAELEQHGVTQSRI
jgi:hypothetical protein